MANSTPIDPRQRGRQSAGGFTPIDLKAGAANLRGPQKSTPAPTPQKGGSRGERNNNPGNLEDGAFARSQPGYAGSDGRFARFKSPADGERAQETLLRKNYANMSVAQIVQKYAPLGDNSEESVRNYIGYVASRAGVDPDAKLGDGHYNQVAAAMRAFETGKRGKIQFRPYGGQLTRASSGGGAGETGRDARITVPNSQVPGASGRPNTGVMTQGSRTFNDGPRLEGQQRIIEGEAVQAGELLDSYMTQLQDTQQVRVNELKAQTETVRGINQTMTDATNEMIKRVEPIFQRRQEILDQALEIQDMSPIARSIRGFFDLNYNEKFLMSQASKLGQIVAQSAESYQMMQALHQDAIQNADRLFSINTALPEAELTHLMQRTQAQEMIVQRAQQNLEIIRGGITNETMLASSQARLRDDMLTRLDNPTKIQLLGQAEQNGGTVAFNGVVLSAQELRESAQRSESFEYSLETQRMAVANGRADIADKSAARMVEYATDSQIETAIANGGVLEGVQIPAGLLTQEKARRAEAVIQDAQRKEIESTPKQVLDDAYATIAYERQLTAKMSTIFGPHTVDTESVSLSTEVSRISTALKEAYERGASPLELGVLRNQLAKARQAFNTSVQAKVKRMVGNDEEGAAYIQSYLMGDRPTPQAAAGMLVHFASKGGLPAAVMSGDFGRDAMQETMNLISKLRTTKNPSTGKAFTESQALKEAQRLIADSSTPEGRRFRQVTAGKTFQSRFSVLPRLAAPGGNVIHPFGNMNYKTFYSLSNQADAYGNNRVAADNGFDLSKADQRAQWQAILDGQAPAGVDPKRAQELVAKKDQLAKQVANEQAYRLGVLLDQEPRLSEEMTNSQLMLDFLESPEGATAIEATEQSAGNGGLMDWMAGNISMGGVKSNMSSYTGTYRENLGQRDAERGAQSLRLADGFRNDPIRRMGAIASGMGLKRGEIVRLAGAIAPLLPKGNEQQTQEMLSAAQAEASIPQGIRSGINPVGPSGTYSVRTPLAIAQINAIDTIITSHKFDDPEVEAIRKELAKDWKDFSRQSDNFIDGLIGR